MKITQSFTIARPAAAVWNFFQDVPAVAACLPGAELVESRADGTARGKVAIKLGPFNASFEGEAKIAADPATQSGHVDGRGVDRRGGSHSRMVLDYKLAEGDGGGTRVDIDVDLTLSGPVAQFGRTGLVTETAKVLIGEFVRNLETRMAAPGAATAAPAPAANRINAMTLLLAVLRGWLKKLFG
jgi:carbon monoxide dehydrogenase subunit G